MDDSDDIDSEDELTLQEIADRLKRPPKTFDSDSVSKLQSALDFFKSCSELRSAERLKITMRLQEIVHKFDGHVSEDSSLPSCLVLSFPARGGHVSQNFAVSPKSGTLMLEIKLFATALNSEDLRLSWNKSVYVASMQKWNLLCSTSAMSPNVYVVDEQPISDFVHNLVRSIEGWAVYAANLQCLLRWLVPSCEETLNAGSLIAFNLSSHAVLQKSHFRIVLTGQNDLCIRNHIALHIVLQIHQADIDCKSPPRIVAQLCEIFRTASTWRWAFKTRPSDIEKYRTEFDQFQSSHKVCQIVRYFTDLQSSSSDGLGNRLKTTNFCSLGIERIDKNPGFPTVSRFPIQVMVERREMEIPNLSWERTPQCKLGSVDSVGVGEKCPAISLAPIMARSAPTLKQSIDFLGNYVEKLGGVLEWNEPVVHIQIKKQIGNIFPALTELIYLNEPHLGTIKAVHSRYFSARKWAYDQAVITKLTFHSLKSWCGVLDHCVQTLDYVAELLQSVAQAAQELKPHPSMRIVQGPRSVSYYCVFGCKVSVAIDVELAGYSLSRVTWNAVKVEIKRNLSVVYKKALLVKSWADFAGAAQAFSTELNIAQKKVSWLMQDADAPSSERIHRYRYHNTHKGQTSHKLDSNSNRVQILPMANKDKVARNSKNPADLSFHSEEATRTNCCNAEATRASTVSRTHSDLNKRFRISTSQLLPATELEMKVPESMDELKTFIRMWEPHGFVTNLISGCSQCCMYFSKSMGWNQVDIYVGGLSPHIFASAPYFPDAAFAAVQVKMVDRMTAPQQQYYCLIEVLSSYDLHMRRWRNYVFQKTSSDLSWVLHSWIPSTIGKLISAAKAKSVNEADMARDACFAGLRADLMLGMPEATNVKQVVKVVDDELVACSSGIDMKTEVQVVEDLVVGADNIYVKPELKLGEEDDDFL